MKLYILAALCVSLVSCSETIVKEFKGESIIPNYNSALDHIDPSLVPYLEEVEYILQYNSQVGALRFIDESEMEGLSETIQGICKSKGRVILLRRSTWERASEEWRVALVLHEAGHCDFGHDHTKENVNDECDGNIMHPRTTCTYRAFIGKSDDHIRKEIKQ